MTIHDGCLRVNLTETRDIYAQAKSCSYFTKTRPQQAFTNMACAMCHQRIRIKMYSSSTPDSSSSFDYYTAYSRDVRVPCQTEVCYQGHRSPASSSSRDRKRSFRLPHFQADGVSQDITCWKSLADHLGAMLLAYHNLGAHCWSQRRTSGPISTSPPPPEVFR